MRLLQVIAGGEHGGFETFCVSLAGELARVPGLEQRVVTRPWPSRLASLAAMGVPAVPTRLGGPLDLPSRFLIRREIARYRPHIVLTWANRATSMTPRAGAPICARIGHYYKLKHYRHADFLITITERLRDYVVAGGFPADRVAAIPNFHRARGAAPADRAALSTPADAPLVTAVGRLHRAKGFDVLLQAMADVKDAYLWIAGTGPEEPSLKALAEGLGLSGRVRFLGWRDDAEALMRAADVVAMPSRSEGLGTVIFEAWASGTPLVAAASEGPGEFVRDGENGRLVPVDDARALAAAIGDLLGDREEASRIGAAALALYEANYTAERIAARYAETLQGFARTGPRSGPRRLALRAADTSALELRAAMAPGRASG